MEYSLTLNFGTSEGQKAAIRISDVKSEISQEQISALMDTIIEKDIFITSKGSLVSKASAQLVGKNTEKYDFK